MDKFRERMLKDLADINGTHKNPCYQCKCNSDDSLCEKKFAFMGLTTSACLRMEYVYEIKFDRNIECDIMKLESVTIIDRDLLLNFSNGLTYSMASNSMINESVTLS
jgi:hypothetical protein